ncbi:MAG TPA: hypothetical protein VMR08_03790 [Patescibacteria group bacterium]|nr:hypothetical protein [Patescibacteria group bacterium]
MEEDLPTKFSWSRTYVLIVAMIAVAAISYWLIPTGSKTSTNTASSCTALSTAPSCHKSVVSSPTSVSSRPSFNTGSTSSAAAATANTGPGNVIAIFIGATLISATGYYVYSKRRAGRSEPDRQ